MRRTTVYFDPELELLLKREARRAKRPMADVVREAVRAYVSDGPTRRPPGAGAFASGRKDTAARADAWLRKSRFGESR